MKKFPDTTADIEIKECIDSAVSFSVIAGAGSGKTTSLITALDYIRVSNGKHLKKNAQKVACVTFTKRAVEVIKQRLNQDDLFHVTTIHSFLWSEISRFQEDIREALKIYIIPCHIEKQKKHSTGKSKRAIAASERMQRLESEVEMLSTVDKFIYDDNTYSDYSAGKLGHDDVIDIVAYLINNNVILKRIIGQKYPYIFIDEAQDTFQNVIEALNAVAESSGLPIVGYFGDPMQQIYEKRAGGFSGPDGSKTITKIENFRCSTSVINLLNSFREDIQQIPGEENADREGSVEIRLIEAEEGEGHRKSYSTSQLDSVTQKFDQALAYWKWDGDEHVKRLFLARQMIARRLGFPKLHRLFTGEFASSNAQTDYESGRHFLLRPFILFIFPAVEAAKNGNINLLLQLMKKYSPAFDPMGSNGEKRIADIISEVHTYSDSLSRLWEEATLGEILRYCIDHNLLRLSVRLEEQLARAPRTEEYDNDTHSLDKGEWLVDEFFKFTTDEIEPYSNFINEATPFSTQHGVKGEEYEKVLVVFDDTEAQWNIYSFAKTLTPEASGAEPTDGQRDRSRKLAYVCFSRAEVDLRIILFTPDPAEAELELIANGLFTKDQVSIG